MDGWIAFHTFSNMAAVRHLDYWNFVILESGRLAKLTMMFDYPVKIWCPSGASFMGGLESLPGPRPYTGVPRTTRIYFIDNQLRQSTDRLGIQRTGDDERRVSPSDILQSITVDDVISVITKHSQVYAKLLVHP